MLILVVFGFGFTTQILWWAAAVPPTFRIDRRIRHVDHASHDESGTR
ncbi:hypothetical protein [Streptomyces avermitilis]